MRRRRSLEPGPLFIQSVCDVRVRFHEMDVLGVVWHGHYAAYFEDGRVAFGREHGLDYVDFHAAGLVAPIIHLEVDYHRPARYGETVVVQTRLHPDEAARLHFTYDIRDGDGRAITSGETLQVFADAKGELLLTQPPFYVEFLERSRTRLRRA